MFWKGRTATVAGVTVAAEGALRRLICQSANAIATRRSKPIAQATFALTVLLAFDALGAPVAVFAATAALIRLDCDELVTTASSPSGLATAARPDFVSRLSRLNSARISEAC